MIKAGVIRYKLIRGVCTPRDFNFDTNRPTPTLTRGCQFQESANISLLVELSEELLLLARHPLIQDSSHIYLFHCYSPLVSIMTDGGDEYDYNAIRDELITHLDTYTSGQADAILRRHPAILNAIRDMVFSLNNRSMTATGDLVLMSLCNKVVTENTTRGLSDQNAFDIARALVHVIESHDGFNMEVDGSEVGHGGGAGVDENPGRDLARRAFDEVAEGDDEDGDGGHDGGHGDGPHGGDGSHDDPDHGGDHPGGGEHGGGGER